MNRWLVVLSALFFCGCTVNGNYSAEGFACDEQDPCPSGFDCLAGLCSALPTGIDGGNIETDASELACVPFVDLSDTFEGPNLDAQWAPTIANGTSLEQSGGVLLLTPGSVNPIRFVRIRSPKLNFADRRASMEVIQMVDATTAAIAEMRVTITNQDYFVIRQTGGVLQFGVVEAGTLEVRAAVPYSPQSHRWWQFRESDGELFAETSPDGQSWTEIGRVTHNEIPEFRVEVAAGTEELVNEPGSLHIDNVNSGSSLCE